MAGTKTHKKIKHVNNHHRSIADFRGSRFDVASKNNNYSLVDVCML